MDGSVHTHEPHLMTPLRVPLKRRSERRYLIDSRVHVGGEAFHDDPIHAHRHDEHASEAEGEEQLLPDIVRPEPRGKAELGAQTRGQAQDRRLEANKG